MFLKVDETKEFKKYIGYIFWDKKKLTLLVPAFQL